MVHATPHRETVNRGQTSYTVASSTDARRRDQILYALPMDRRLARLSAFEWTVGLALAVTVAGCSVGDVTRESSAPLRPRTARMWSITETTLSDSHEGTTEEKGARSLSEIPLPEIQVPPQAPQTAPSSGAPAPNAEVTQVETLAGDPRPIKVPWPGAPEATAADDTSDDDSDGVAARPALLPGRVRAVAPRSASMFPEGLAPGPCCVRHLKECAEFAAAAKVEGTLASRRVESMQLRAHPFGKAAP
jgi:hypothetical protein